MPDKRRHRGPAPQDQALFGLESLERLRRAAADYSLLLTKGYAPKSSLKLVGDRFELTKRQRLAIMRNSCSDQQLEARKQKQLAIELCRGRPILIDGYNLLITAESALAGAFIFRARDGLYRDLAGIHSTYRRVTETTGALGIIGRLLQERHIEKVCWLLDSPISNSAKLKNLMQDMARAQSWNWDIQLEACVDKTLIASDLPVASSDGVVLDNCRRWVNITEILIEAIQPPGIIDLGRV